MSESNDLWKVEANPDGKSEFPFRVKTGDTVICLVKNREDAEFITRARDVMPRLVSEMNLLMSGIDNIRNFVRMLDSNLTELDFEMKKRL